jgi:hypothetical protein
MTTEKTETSFDIAITSELTAACRINTWFEDPDEGDYVAASYMLFLPSVDRLLHSELCFGDRLQVLGESLAHNWGEWCQGTMRQAGTNLDDEFDTHEAARTSARRHAEGEVEKLRAAIDARQAALEAAGC